MPILSEDPAESSASSISSLPDELWYRIGQFLDVLSLQRCREVNRRCSRAFARDAAGWNARCDSLWSNKAHVAFEARRLRSQQKSMNAYFLSCHDAAFRQTIRRDELCFDLDCQTGTVWSFVFKKAAGPDWTDTDPWHRGEESRKFVFLEDGTVQQVKQPDRITSRSDSSSDGGRDVHDRLELHTPFFGGGRANMKIRWKFLSKPLDLPERPTGAYLRLNIAGRDVPTYVVRRSCHGNWGFLVENCWGVFHSFPVARKQEHHRRLEPRPATYVGPQIRRRTRVRQRMSAVVDQEPSSVLMTTQRQWREALLYNLGASNLPEHEEESNLDRAFD